METSNAIDFTNDQVHALRELQSIAPVLVASKAKADEAKAEASAATDHAVQAAIDCGDWQTFEPVITELENRIRDNVDGEAERWNAKAAKTEGRFVVPSSVSGIKSQIKRAFENGVPLTDENGDRRTFNAIKEDNAEIANAEREAQKAEARAEAMAEYSDLREYGAELVARHFELVKTLAESDLAELVTSMESTLGRFESETVESENGSSAEALAA